MYAEKVQRVMMATVLAISAILWIMGVNAWALALQVFVIVMIVVWAITDFCPSLWMLKKFLPSLCKKAE